jgi:hypothetical protein
VGITIAVWILDRSYSIPFSSADINSLTTDDKITKILEILVNKSMVPTYPFAFIWIASLLFGGIFWTLRPISHWIEKSRSSFFCWGDMIQIHERIEQRNTLLKWSLGIALLVSIVGSIIGTLIFTR